MKDQTKPDTATLDSYQLWCARTRDLLRTGKGKGKLTAGRLIDSKETSALDAQIKRVFALLRLLGQDRAQARLYRECLVEFDRIKTETDKPPADGESPDKKAVKDRRAAELATQLETLGTRVKNALQGEGAGDAAKEKELGLLLKHQQQFDEAHQRASQDTNALKASKFARVADVDRIAGELSSAAAAPKTSVAEFEHELQRVKDVQWKVDELKKLVRQDEERSLKNAKDKPTAEMAYTTVVAYRHHANLNHGSEELVATYDTAIKSASEKMKAGAWTDAAGILTPFVGKYKAREVKKAAKAARKELQKIPSYVAAEEDLAALQALASPEAYGKHRAALDVAVKSYLASDTPSIAVFAEVRTAIGTERRTAGEASAELEQLGKDIAALMQRCRTLSPDLTAESFKIDADALAGMVRERRIEAAKELGATLKADLTKELAAQELLKTAWDKEKPKLGALRGDLEVARKRAEAANKSDARSRALKALGRVDGDVRGLEAAHEWERLVAVQVECQLELKRLNEEETAHAGLADALRAADAQITGLKRTVDAAVTAWQKALAQRAQREVVDVDDRVQTTASVVDRWNTAQPDCVTDGELAAARDRAIADLKAIQEFVADASDERALDRLVREDANRRAQPAFDTAWGGFESAVDALRAIDTKTAVTLAAEGQTVRDAAFTDYAQATVRLRPLLDKVAAARLAADGRLLDAQKELDAAATSCNAEIERVKSAGKSRFFGTLPFMKVYAEAFDALEAELKDLKLVRTSENVGAIAAATKQLGALKTQAALYAPDAQPAAATIAGTLAGAADAANATGLAAGGVVEVAAPKVLTMDAVIERYNDALARLKLVEKDLEADDPNSLKGLLPKRDDLTQRIYTVPPEAGHGLIDLFTKALESAEASLLVAQQVRRDYATELALARSTAKTLRKNKAGPEYAKEFKARLEAIEALVASPEKLTAAHSKLKALNAEGGAAALDPQKLLECETKSKKEKQDASEAEVAYEKLRTLTDSTFVSKYVKPKVTYIGMADYAITTNEGDKGLLAELTRMVGLAEKSAKQADWATALKQIELTKTRALQIVQDPYGPAVGSRNALPKHNATFRQALDAFKKTLDTVHAETLQGIQPAAAKAVGDKLQSQLGDIKGYFDPALFEDGIKALTEPKLAAAERRARREVLLAQIRATRARLAQSPKILALLSNPVAGQTFSNGYRRLSDTLNALDSNVQRSC